MLSHSTDHLVKVNRQSRFAFERPLRAQKPMGMTSWGKRIRELRLTRGWTQKELGERINKAQTTIDGYESATKPQEPTIDVFIQLARVFDVNPCWLAFGPSLAIKETVNPNGDGFSQQLMEKVIIVFERFVSKKGFGNLSISPEKRANMLMMAYRLATMLGDVDSLEAEFERLFAIALRD